MQGDHVFPVRSFLGEEANRAVEVLAKPPMPDRLSLVAPAAIVMKLEPEGFERRRAPAGCRTHESAEGSGTQPPAGCARKTPTRS